MIYIYFVEDSGYVKIGRSGRPWKRLSSLQTGNPRPLEMLAIAPGGETFEAGLHAVFEGARQQGEWFEKTPKLERFISAICDVFPDLQLRPYERPLPIDDKGDVEEPAEEGKRNGWIEFPKINGKRYARYREWRKRDGEWKKVYGGRVPDIPPMTEAEYRQWKRRN